MQVTILLLIGSFATALIVPEDPTLCMNWGDINNEIFCFSTGTVVPGESSKFSKSLTVNLDAIEDKTQLPVEFFEINDIDRLFFKNAELIGRLPTEIGKLGVESLSFENNHFTGSIPSEIGDIKKLNYLSLGGNNFGGDIPTEISKLTTLTTLDLSNNLISGSIPLELKELTQLKKLKLNNNYLTGSIPVELTQLELTELDLDKNDLEGYVPFFTISPIDGESMCKLNNPRLYCPFPENCTPGCFGNDCSLNTKPECPCQLNSEIVNCDEETTLIEETTLVETSEEETTLIEKTTLVETSEEETTLVETSEVETSEATKSSLQIILEEESQDSLDFQLIIVIIGCVVVFVLLAIIIVLVRVIASKTQQKDPEINKNIEPNNSLPYHPPQYPPH